MSELTEIDQKLNSIMSCMGRDMNEINQFYAMLLRTPLYVPADINADSSEEYSPWFTKIDDEFFLVCFDTQERYEHWISSIDDDKRPKCMVMHGHNLIENIGVDVYLALNPGLPFYKEFHPDEIKRLKKVVERTKPPA